MLTVFLLLAVVSALAADWEGDTIIGALARVVFHIVLLMFIAGLAAWYFTDPLGAQSSSGYWMVITITLVFIYRLGGFDNG